MAKQTLPTNYKDDVLATSMGKKRRYNLIQNDDGTISLEDATEYTQVGDNYGAAQLNATNQAVNESVDQAKVIDSLDDISANTQPGMVAGALAVAELNGKMDEQKYKVGTVTLGYYDASYLYATIDLGTDQWNGGVIFTSMFSIRNTPYEQVISFSATQIQDNKVTIWARGSGFVNGHSLLVGYLIIPKN